MEAPSPRRNCIAWGTDNVAVSFNGMAFASQDVPHMEVDVSLMLESTMSSSNYRRSIAEQKALPVAEADLDIMNLDGHDESNSSSSSLFSSNPDQNDILSNSSPSSNPVEVNEFETLDNSDADKSNTNTEFAVIISRSVLTQDHAKRTQESIKRDFQTMMPGLSPTGFKFAEQYSKKEAYEIRQQYGILEFVVITFSTRREQMVTVKGLDGKVADFREIKFHMRESNARSSLEIDLLLPSNDTASPPLPSSPQPRGNTPSVISSSMNIGQQSMSTPQTVPPPLTQSNVPMYKQAAWDFFKNKNLREKTRDCRIDAETLREKVKRRRLLSKATDDEFDASNSEDDAMMDG